MLVALRLTTTILVVSAGIALVACNDSGFKGEAGKRTPARKLITTTLTQDSYPTKQVSWNQGFGGDAGEFVFDQGKLGKLDVLIVIDNSGSMQEEQANLAGKLHPLLSAVQAADWQVAVATTDPSDKCFRDRIVKGEQNIASRFAVAIQAGTSGSGIERGVLQAARGISGDCGSFLRPDSTLAVLLVSDEDNCHIDLNRGYDTTTCREELNDRYLLDSISAVREIGKTAKIYGIIWHPDQPQDQCQTALKSGDQYARLIAETTGTYGSICDNDYTDTLETISRDVAEILEYEVELQHIPDAGTLKVLVDGKTWSDYSLEGTTVKFGEAPAFGTKVEVRYKHGAAGTISDTVDLGGVAVAGSPKVMVDGKELATTEFVVSADGRAVTFLDMPPESAKAEIEYLEKIDLPKTFALPGQIDAATIGATLAGKEVAVTYDPEKQELNFAEPPPAGSIIEVRYSLKWE